MPSYLEEVESLFLSAVRKGLSLRVADVEIVRDWQSRGVPVDVVSRGIMAGIRKFLAEAEPDAPVPSSLKYYRSAVEKDFETWQRAAARGLASASMSSIAGDPATAAAPNKTTSLQDRARTVLAARLATATESAAPVYSKALAFLDGSLDSTPLADLLFQVEDMLVTELGQSLGSDEFARLRAGVEEQTRVAAGRGVGRLAVEDLRRSLLRKAVAESIGYESFLDEVLEKQKSAKKS